MSSSDTGGEGAQAGGYEDRAEAHKRQCERSGAIVDAMRPRMFALLCALFATTGALATCGVAMKAAHDVNGFNENMGREEYASGPFRAEAAAPGNLISENGLGLTVRGARARAARSLSRARAARSWWCDAVRIAG